MGGNEWLLFVGFVAVVALLVWGLWALIRSAVRSGRRDP